MLKVSELLFKGLHYLDSEQKQKIRQADSSLSTSVPTGFKDTRKGQVFPQTLGFISVLGVVMLLWRSKNSSAKMQ